MSSHPSIPTHDYRATAYVLLTQVLVAMSCFLLLIATFQFPDILREPSAYRLDLFRQNSDIIIPTYYLLALTGLSQVVISVLMFKVFNCNSSLVLLTAVFGVLCGVFQTIGFIRWPFLIDYLANAPAMSDQAIGFMEGAFNRYAGMAIGEHLGFLMQGLWTLLLSISMLKTKLFSTILGKVGVIIGILSLMMSFEPLAPSYEWLAELTNPVESAWYIWLVFLAVTLLRWCKASTEQTPRFGLVSTVIAVLFWCSFVLPGYF